MSERREQRLVFGDAAERYHRSRPSYPTEMVDDLVALMGTVPLMGTAAAKPDASRSTAIDIGAGTGKASLLLAERGFDGIALEPDPNMAAVARRTLAPFDGWSVVETEFERWERPRGVEVDLVICAQAWHWLSADTRVELACQLLAPGGWLALCWNRPAAGHGSLRSAIEAAYAAHAPAMTAREPGGKGVPPSDEIRGDDRFGSEVSRRYHWSHQLDSSGYCALLGTQSDHLLLPVEQRIALFDAITAAIDAHDGTIEVPTLTDLWAVPRRIC